MNSETVAFADIFHSYYTRCNLQYNIDCSSDLFSDACVSNVELWKTCTSPERAILNESALIEDIREINQARLTAAGNNSDMFAIQIPAAQMNPCQVGRGCLEHQLYELVWYDHERVFPYYAPIAAIMCLVALFTNAVGLTGLSQIDPKYPRHFFLLSMSISDTLLSFLTLFKRTADVVRSSSDIKRFITEYVNLFWQATFIASALMLLALALEAFVALSATFFYEKAAQKRKPVLGFIAVVWAVSFTFPLILLVTQKSYSMAFQYIVAALLVFIIVITISCYLYAFMLAERARKDIHRQKRASSLGTRNNGDKSGRRKSLLTVCLLMTSSIVSWLPFTIYMLLGDTVERNFPFYNRLLNVFLIMFHLNAIINPLTYALRMNAVRTKLRKFLRITGKKPSIFIRSTTTTTVQTENTNIMLKSETQPGDNGMAVSLIAANRQAATAEDQSTNFSEDNPRSFSHDSVPDHVDGTDRISLGNDASSSNDDNEVDSDSLIINAMCTF